MNSAGAIARGAVLGSHKLFLANGAPSLRAMNQLAYSCFVEGGNGVDDLPAAHLCPTPLVLGNMGDLKTRRGVFESVKKCLEAGCVYSPPGVNLLLDGPDNFVCKLYPLTVQEIGPGTVIGKERLITTVSGSFRWTGPARLFRYDSNGQPLQQLAPQLEKSGHIDVQVPVRGLVIVEALGER